MSGLCWIVRVACIDCCQMLLGCSSHSTLHAHNLHSQSINLLHTFCYCHLSLYTTPTLTFHTYYLFHSVRTQLPPHFVATGIAHKRLLLYANLIDYPYIFICC